MFFISFLLASVSSFQLGDEMVTSLDIPKIPGTTNLTPQGHPSVHLGVKNM